MSFPCVHFIFFLCSIWPSEQGRSMRIHHVIPDALSDIVIRLDGKQFLLAPRLGDCRGIDAFRNTAIRSYW